MKESVDDATISKSIPRLPHSNKNNAKVLHPAAVFERVFIHSLVHSRQGGYDGRKRWIGVGYAV